jgi:hypothetical protein
MLAPAGEPLVSPTAASRNGARRVNLKACWRQRTFRIASLQGREIFVLANP